MKTRDMFRGPITWVLVLCLATTASAQSINPPTTPQVTPMNSREKGNLGLVLNWWREVLYAGHMELTSKYQTESYIQHNPNVSTGRAAFVALFSKFIKPINPIPATMPDMPVVEGAKGDYVWLIFEHQEKDPRDPLKTYYYNSFDLLRIERGKIAEHWDSDRKSPGSGNVITGVSPRPPMGWNTGRLSTEERQTLALASEELKDMLQYGHLELADKVMDANYIQHNPNVPQGRNGFKEFMSRATGRQPEEIKREWKRAPVLTLVSGPYCFMMWDRSAKDPDDPSRTYTFNHFDVVRIENGLAKEHWDEAMLYPPG